MSKVSPICSFNHRPYVTGGQHVIKRNAHLLFGSALGKRQCDALVPGGNDTKYFWQREHFIKSLLKVFPYFCVVSSLQNLPITGIRYLWYHYHFPIHMSMLFMLQGADCEHVKILTMLTNETQAYTSYCSNFPVASQKAMLCDDDALINNNNFTNSFF